MVSAADRAKRALVALLKRLAAKYAVTLSILRDTPDAGVARAYRKVSLKAHPDHGGQPQDQTDLNNAYSAWCGAKRSAQGRHGGAPTPARFHRRCKCHLFYPGTEKPEQREGVSHPGLGRFVDLPEVFGHGRVG